MIRKKIKYLNFVFVLFFISVLSVCFCGCSGLKGYSNESLFDEDVKSVYVEMFDSISFRRGAEYVLTDALAKQIEASTPYKIVSDRSKADTVLGGQIVGISGGAISTEYETGRALERDVVLAATVNWKNLKTGELLVDDIRVSASANYSEWQNQGFDYGTSVAANKLAKRIVELMENEW